MRYGDSERESIEEEGDSVPGEPPRVCRGRVSLQNRGESLTLLLILPAGLAVWNGELI